ncbi:MULTISPECIES: hypothetical protein [Clostridia]|uniref:hypothetical protein n=1 Tax=Clostridia TaxID=186801 RepID=UPI002A8DCEDF|nr:hypothetical protein [Peptostreptococcus porci]MDY5098757.1 hypothetical protein [Clostridium sp.]MDY5437422.1 hypothetical protein [Peptostreptococcus porci]
MNKFDGLISLENAAKKYGKSGSTLRTYIARGKFKENVDYKKFGKTIVFNESALDKFYRRVLEKKKEREIKMKYFQMAGHNGLATCRKLEEAGWVMTEAIIDDCLTRGWNFKKGNDHANIWLDGIQPHETMDDLIITFTGQELFKLFPDNWFAEEGTLKMDTKNWHLGKDY